MRWGIWLLQASVPFFRSLRCTSTTSSSFWQRNEWSNPRVAVWSSESHFHSLQILRVSDKSLLFAAPLSDPYDIHLLILEERKLLSSKVIRKKGPNRKIRKIVVKKNISCLSKASANSMLMCGEYFNTYLLTVSFADTKKTKKSLTSFCSLI